MADPRKAKGGTKAPKPAKHLQPVSTDGEAPNLSRTPSLERIKQIPRFTGWGIDTLSGWTVDAMRAALAEHAFGTFRQTGTLQDDLFSNAYIRDAMEERWRCFTSLPTIVTPSSRGEGRRAADFFREVLPEIWPLSTRRDQHKHLRFMGQSVCAIEWEERTDGKDRWWLPVLKPWHPSLIQYQYRFKERSMDGGAYVATTLNGLKLVEPGMGRWLLLTDGTLQPWMNGLIRVLGEPFLGDIYNFADNMAHQERYSRGILKLKHPANWKDEQIASMAAQIRQNGGGGVATCAQSTDGKTGVDLDLLRIDGAGYQTFDATEKRLLRRILIAILGQEMSTTATPGALGAAPAELQGSVLWAKLESDAAVFGDARLEVEQRLEGDRLTDHKVWVPCNGPMRSQLWRWIAYYNFGSFDLAPYVWMNATEPKDYEARERRQVELGEIRARTAATLAGLVGKLNPDQIAALANQCGIEWPTNVDRTGHVVGGTEEDGGDDDDEGDEDGELDELVREVQVRIGAIGSGFKSKGIGHYTKEAEKLYSGLGSDSATAIATHVALSLHGETIIQGAKKSIWNGPHGVSIHVNARVHPAEYGLIDRQIHAVIGHSSDLQSAMRATSATLYVVPKDSNITKHKPFHSLRGKGSNGFDYVVARGVANVSYEKRNYTAILESGRAAIERNTIADHEIAHTVHFASEKSTHHKDLDQKIRKLYNDKLYDKLWKWPSEYGSLNHYEYWAESSAAWHGVSLESRNRQWMKQNDKPMAKLLKDVYGDE